jgi:hypothetical protein
MTKEFAIEMLRQGQDGQTILRILDTLNDGVDSDDDPESAEMS